MFIQSHLEHEIFTYGLKGWFLIPFAASDKLIKSFFFFPRKSVPFHSCLQNDWSKMFSVSGMLGSHIHQFSWQRTQLIRACTDVFKTALTCFQSLADTSVKVQDTAEHWRLSAHTSPTAGKTTLNCRPSFPCSEGTINSLWLFKIMHSYHLVKTYTCITSHKTKAMEI